MASLVPWRVVPSGVVLRVRATPRSRADAIKGIVELAGVDAGVALNVSTTAAPDGGAANAAITATLAKELGVPKSAVRIAAGGAGRVKRVEIDSSDVSRLVERLKDVCQ